MAGNSKGLSGTWVKATPQQMVNRLKLDLSITPKWRVFKRMQINRSIEYWTQVKEKPNGR